MPLRVRGASAQEWDVPRLLLDLWLHSDLPRLAQRPFPLRLGVVGAACYLSDGPVPGPPLPIIGVRALCLASIAIELRCNPTGGTLNLRVPRHFHSGPTHPIPNMAVKPPGPMVVAPAARVGHRWISSTEARWFKTSGPFVFNWVSAFSAKTISLPHRG